ncbi:hypothetical protein GLOIN_2v1486734 [Rhizophagus irregularis DAOM 181602=DAOM 197198]|nr:hypothetical protein GLOIN_2v1486734 [Rhizophagus irregularis DAOM 181602=DAOM 197198]
MNYSMWLLIKWTETNRRFMMDSQLLPSSLEIPFFFYCKSAVSTVIRRKSWFTTHILIRHVRYHKEKQEGPTNMRTIVQSYSCVQGRYEATAREWNMLVDYVYARTSVEFYPILELLIKKKNLKRYSHLKGRLGKDVDISLWNDTITNIIILNNKIISVKTFEASTLLYCHLFDFNEMIDNKPSLCFYSIYCKNCDGFSIYLTEWISYAIK